MGEEERRRCCIIINGGCCIEYLAGGGDASAQREQAMIEELLSYWPAGAGNPPPHVLKALAAGLLKNFGFTTPEVGNAIYHSYKALFTEALKA